MRAADALGLWLGALRGHRSRSLMLLLAVGIGVVAVNLLTGLGEGARSYILGEFAVLGRNTLIVLPGRKETSGGMPPITGLAPRDLTLQDAQAIARLPSVLRVAPLQAGQVEVSVGNRNREAFTLGTSHEFFAIRQLQVSQGQALPALHFDEARAVCVIGAKLRRELFGNAPALGQWLRAGDRRFRVVGILAERGESLGMDFGEMLIIPVASAQTLFDREGLFRVFAELRGPHLLASGKAQIRATIRERHEGEDDITLIGQDAMLAAFADILRALTLALAGIAAISLLVAGILIMNVTWISVSQRTAEIGVAIEKGEQFLLRQRPHERQHRLMQGRRGGEGPVDGDLLRHPVRILPDRGQRRGEIASRQGVEFRNPPRCHDRSARLVTRSSSGGRN